MATTVEELVAVLRWKSDRAAARGVAKDLKNIRHEAKASGNTLNALRMAMIEAFAARAIASGARATIGFLVETNAKFEVLQARLHTLTGSESNAARVFEMIREFAIKTPFEVSNITEAYSTLRSAGLIPTMSMLRDFGDMAGGMGKSLGEVAVAVRAALAGEMEPLANTTGIKMLVMGDKLRASFNGTTEVVDRNAGAITAFLRKVARERFSGGMERQAKTLAGAWSNTVDAAEGLAMSVGERGLMDALKKATLSFTDVLTSSDALAEGLGEGLGNAADAAVGWFEDLLKSAQDLTSEDVEEWVNSGVEALKDFIEMGRKLLDLLDKITTAGGGTVTMIKAMGTAWAAVKILSIVQGLAGVATQMRAVGVASALAGGPAGAILATFAALIPILAQLNMQQRTLRGSVRRTREGAPKALGEAIEAGEMSREQAFKKSKLEREREEARVKFETSDSDVARSIWKERFEKSEAELKALQKDIDKFARTEKKKRDVTAKELKFRRDNATAFAENIAIVAESEGLKVPKAKRKQFMEALEQAVREDASDEEALQQAKLFLNEIGVPKKAKSKKDKGTAFEQAVKSRRAELVGKVEMSSGALLPPGTPQSVRETVAKAAGKAEGDRIDQALAAGNLGVLGLDFLKSSSAIMERATARIDELSQQAELSAGMRARGTAAQRAAIGTQAGTAERERLTRALEAGHFEALGGEFSAERQLLREMGLVDEAINVSPPLLTVVNNRYDVVVNSSVNVDKAVATADDIGKSTEAAALRVWDKQVRKDIEANPIRQVR